jgi:hypothetical protein
MRLSERHSAVVWRADLHAALCGGANSAMRVSRSGSVSASGSTLAEEPAEDIPVGLLVVGSGSGRVTATLCAYEPSVENILVIEKSDQYGRTNAMSGNVAWIPWNRYVRESGVQDSVEALREYLQRTIPPGLLLAEILDT